jgi:NAD(P)-dependent dehydrogenase (short-subunit alcohol dehydrogenase family)
MRAAHPKAVLLPPAPQGRAPKGCSWDRREQTPFAGQPHEAKLDLLKRELADRGATYVVDVVDEESVKTAVNAAVTTFGTLYVAVNCAGVADAAKTIPNKGEPFSIAIWNEVIGINLTGTFNIIPFAALAMTKNAPEGDDGERGVIVNTASGAAWQGQMGQAAYSASKAGVMGLTLPVARDLAQHGIRIVSIAPGLFETPMVAGMPPNVSQSIIDRMVQALGCQRAEFALRHVEPTAVLWRVVPFEALAQPSRFGGGESRVQRRWPVRREIVLHQHDLDGTRRMRVGQILEHMGVVDGGPAVCDLDTAPALQRREHHPHETRRS